MDEVTRRRIVRVLMESHCRREAARLDLRDAVNDDDMRSVLVASICYFGIVREHDGLVRALMAVTSDAAAFVGMQDTAAERCTGGEIEKYRARDAQTLRRRMIDLLEEQER